MVSLYFCFHGDGDHRDLHVLTHSFPTRRSSDLKPGDEQLGLALLADFHDGLARTVFGTDPAVSVRRSVSRLCRVHGERKCQPSCFHAGRSEEHTSELQSLMRISYAVFCLKKKKRKI